MNKHLYRIVFNERRGQLMVVGDNVMSTGKAASGQGGTASCPSGETPLDTPMRSSCLNLYVAFGVLVGLAAPIHAQIVADPSAPGSQRATVLQTSNGVVQVNMQTPSAAGVSRNVYSQFDVTARGAVLNNSRTDVQSQIGGWVQGNPWLAGGGARVILNEVNSIHPSKLNGYLEVAGQRAELVVANPSGVNVDGGGFINASRVTITTGNPRMDGGSLDGYLVERGAVTISGRGMDAAEADYVGILARAVQMNAGIWAKELRVATGANQINASHTSTTAQAGVGLAPSFALDVAYLGGMYAGKIMLIGTEAGVGMRNSGIISASAGDLVLEANGWLRNSGSMQAIAQGSNARLDVAGDMDNTGTVYAAGDTRVASGGNILSSGLIAAQADVAVLANGGASRIDVDARGTFASGLNGDGTLGSTGNMRMTATQDVSFHGLGTAAGNVELRSAAMDLSGARLFGNDLALRATDGNLNASGANINARGALAFGANGTVRTDAAQVEANTLSVGARDLSNVGGKISQLGSSDLAILLPGTLDNTAGRIAANSGSLAIAADNLANADGIIEHAGTGTLAITAESVTGARGTITGNGSVDITTGQFDHRGASTSGLQLTISAAHLDNSGGRVSAIGSTILAADGGVNNTDGSVSAGVDLILLAGDVDNSRGVLQARARDVTLRVAGLNNVAGNVYAGGKLNTTATSVVNSGSLYAAGNQHLVVSGAIANSGVIAAQGDTTVTANSLTSTAASLLWAGVKADGALVRTGDLRVTTEANLAALGQNLAAGQATLAGAEVDVSGSQTGATGIALLAGAGNVTTRGATIVARDTLAVAASSGGQGLVNTQGTLSAAQLDVQVANLDNEQGTIIQSGASDTRIVLTSADGRFDNTGGRIAVNSANLTLAAATLVNTDGRIEHAGAGALDITATNLDGQRGQITGNGGVLITASEFDHNGAGTSGRAVSVHADSFSNRGGHLLQSGAGELTLQVAHQIDNAGGEIASDGSLQVQAGAIDNSAGRLTSAASAQVASAGVLNNSDGVVAAAHALTVAADAIGNSRGAIQAGAGALSLSAASLLNSDGVVSAGTDLMAGVTGELRNSGVMYAGRDQALDVGGAFVNAGSVAALANVAIAASSVDSGPGALLGAGIKSDGSLAHSGTLTVGAAHSLRAGGQNLAAGDMSLSGSSVDLGDSESGAANIAITATGGNVTTRNASVNTAGILSVTANAVAGQTLHNGQGTLSAGQLALNVANLNNDHGTLIQSGSGNTEITLSEPDGTLDNTSGRIATNAGNLTMRAGLLVNTDGKIEHAGTGTLAIDATTLNGQRGQIIGNGAFAIAAGEFDHRGASTTAQQVTITAANLNNRAGQIAQLGAGRTTVTASGKIDNSGGKIDSNGEAAIGAATLENMGGRIGAMGSMAVAASIGLANGDGLIATGADLTVLAGNVDNSRGVLQAQSGDVTLRVAGLNNVAGSVYAGGKLDATATRVDNSGSLYAAGDQRLAVSGGIANTGAIAAQGNTVITANSLASSATSLLGAGVKADGGLAQAGDLTVTTGGNLAAYGQNLAVGQATLAGASVDVSGSQIGATGIALRASGGDVATSGATVVATGALAVTASQDGQSLTNTHGTLSAGQLEVQVANLDNKQGTIIQSGAGDTRVVLTSVDGRFDNTGGRIAVNSANLTLAAATLANTDGRIEHAGTGALDITATNLDGQRGQIKGNGSLLITAGHIDHRAASIDADRLTIAALSLDNRDGSIIQGGSGQGAIGISGTLDNRSGKIASNGDAVISAGTLYNQRGIVQASGAATLDLRVDGVLDNRDAGRVAAGQNVMLSAGSIRNQLGQISAGATVSANATGAIQNDNGRLIAGGDVRLIAATLKNTWGMIAAELGNASATTGGAIDNDSGVIQAAGDLILQTGELSNTQALGYAESGRIVGRNVEIDTHDWTLNNQLGTIASAEKLDVKSGALINDAGLLQAGSALSIDTAGQTLSNTNAAGYGLLHADSTGGIVSAGAITLNVGDWHNAGGFSGAGGALSGSTAMVDNTLLNGAGGQIVSRSSLNLNITGLKNQGGQIQALGDVALNAGDGVIDNRESLIRSGSILTLEAGTVENRATHGIEHGLEGQDVNVDAEFLANNQGAVRADNNVAINSAGRVDNTDGMVSAGNALNIVDLGPSRSLEIVNTGGVLIGGGQTNVRATILSGDGQVLSLGNMTVNLSGDYIQQATGAITANNNVSMIVAGELRNFGKLRAGAELKISARDIDNSAQGEISASGTRIHATGVLSNRGLIDGFETEVDAGTLNNTGTGRIYGDHVSIAAGQLNNDTEEGRSATIAARNRLDIGASSLNNLEHALIFSSGDMVIGGALNSDREAIGRADKVTNASASIESLGHLSLNARQVNNLNNHFETELAAVEVPFSFTEYQGISSIKPNGVSSPTRYLAGTTDVYTYDDGQFFHLNTPEALYNDAWSRYDTTRTTRQTVITNSDPGRIVSGSNLTIAADNVLNKDSHILAGGLLSVGTGVLENTAAEGQRITSDSGTATLYRRIYLSGKDKTAAPVLTYYTLPDIIESISLGSSRVEQYTASAGTVVPSAVAPGAVSGTTSGMGSASAEVNTSAIVKVATDGTAVSTASAQGAEVTKGADGLQGTTRHTADQPGAIGEVSGARAADLSRSDGVYSSVGTDLTVSPFSMDRTSSDVAIAAVGLGPVDQVRPGHMTQVTLAHPSAGAQVVRTSAPTIMLPTASLYTNNPAPTARYLIATDARFANYQQWLGSDYMLDQLQLDPSITQKRLGDGFYEQSLIRAQVAQLTGQRYLAGYSNDDEEYRALMNAGVAVAKTMNLRPGIALSAAQMAALTDDIVWMVEKEVTLVDGSVQKVLAPQVYVRVREGDLDGGGALMAGKDVDIRAARDLVNSGTIGGRDSARLAADNVQNLGGRIHSDVVSVAAKNDLNNIGGVISANSALTATAGRDINVETTTRSGTTSAGRNSFARTSLDRVGGLYVTGDGSNGSGTLVAQAGRDVNLVAGQIGNAGKDGATAITAGRHLNLATVGTASSNSINWDAKNYRKDSSTTEVGSQIQASGAIKLIAGVDINARAADVQAGTALTATAGNDINIVSGVNTVKVDEGHQSTRKGFLSRKTITTRDTLDRTSALGTSLGGDTVTLVAGNDINVIGSAIAGDSDVNLTAANALTVVAATETSSESHHRSVAEKGFLSGGSGFGISYGTRTTTTDQSQDAAVQSGQARSIIGSIGGNLNVTAGDALKISGSDLTAGKDMNLGGKSVAIKAGVDDVNGKFTTKMTQDAVTLAIGGSVVNAIQTAQTMGSAAGQTSSGRLKALAAASAAMTANDAAQDLPKNGPSVKISLTVGHSESESTEVTASRTHGGSVLAAGKNVTIAAAGGGKASNIDIAGSDVRGAGTVSLAADNQVNLLAAQDSESQHSQSKSWSAAVGVAAELSSKGAAYGVTASASASRGTVDGEGTIQINSHVSAGDRLAIASGGDTNLKGAIASGSQVVADVKGNLNIESLQDTATLDGKRQSASVSGTVGAGAGFSASVSQSKVHNDYASVQEQSGIRAGDDGFQVQVAGNTDLKGGVISSSEQAINDGRNSLATATFSFSDIQNRDSHDASGISLGVNVGKNQNGGTFSPGMAPGIGQVSGSQGSVTRSGLSGAALTVSDQQAGLVVADLNRDVRTGKDTSQSLTKGWSGAQALDEVGAQMQITSAALPRLAKGIGDYADAKVAELNKQGNADEAAMWAEGGIYRVTAHAALGAMGGGLNGAVGAAAAAEAAPTLGKLQGTLQDKLAGAGLSDDAANVAAKLMAGGAAAAIGGVASGGAGAGTALNTDANNRQLHPKEMGLAKQLADRSGGKFSAKQIADAMRAGGNSALDENVTTGMVVPLTKDTPAGAIYDTEGMRLVSDGEGHSFMVQLVQSRVDPDLAAFIKNNTGGPQSPYAWQPSVLGVVAPAVSVESSNPFTPNAAGCVTAECAAGIPGNRNHAAGETQFLGGLQATAGSAQAIGGGALITAGLASCLGTVGVGCVVAGVGVFQVFAGLDNVNTGAKTAVDATPHSTTGGRWLQNAGLSPEGAELVYGGLQFGTGYGAVKLAGGYDTIISNIKYSAPSNADAFKNAARTEGNFYRDGSIVDIGEHFGKFEDGASLLAPAEIVGKYPVMGRADGLFVSSPDYISALLKRTGGDNTLIKVELGIEPQYWNGPLVRVNIPDPLEMNPRLPSGLESGANSLFIRGGYTPLGAPEIVIDPIPIDFLKAVQVKTRK